MVADAPRHTFSPLRRPMSRKAIAPQVLAAVVADQPRTFVTKDVSEDVRMRDAHPDLVGHRNYHAFVGGAISDHRVKLQVGQLRKRTARGSEWEKRGRAD